MLPSSCGFAFPLVIVHGRQGFPGHRRNTPSQAHKEKTKASEDVLQEIVRNAVPLTQCITLSMAHMTEADSVILARLSLQSQTGNDESTWVQDEWVIDRQYGFVLQLTQREKRLEMLRVEGISAALYLLLESLTKETGIGFVVFDRDERVMGQLHTFDW